MNNIKRLYRFLIIILCILSSGFTDIQHEDKLQIKDIEVFQKVPLLIKPYEPGEPIFWDRPYSDHIKDERLNDLYLVKIPRHLKFDVMLNLPKDMTIYRAICEKNHNDFVNWEKTSILMAMGGDSCINFKVIKKKFKAGWNSFKPGGPFSSSPIFLSPQ